jgi:hypothetical protein
MPKENCARFLWAFAIVLFAMMLLNPLGYQWDLRSYYDGALAYRNGINPYTLEGFSLISERHAGVGYIYLPTVLFYFLPFSYLSVAWASQLYILLKVSAFAVLWQLWRKYFEVPSAKECLTMLILLFAYNATLGWDIIAGNVTVFEQIFLWTALCFFLQERYFLFAICVVLGSQVKLHPILFLGLLFFAEGKSPLRAFVFGALLYLLYFAINYFFFPDLTQHFFAITGQTSTDEHGIACPSIFSFWRDFSYFFTTFSIPIQLGEKFPKILTILSNLGILGLALRAFRHDFFRRHSREEILEIIFLFILTYGLLLPRLKSYQFILFLPSTFYFLRQYGKKYQAMWPLVFLLLPATFGQMTDPITSYPLMGIRKAFRLAYEYSPLLVLLWIWWEWLKIKVSKSFRKPLAV